MNRFRTHRFTNEELNRFEPIVKHRDSSINELRGIKSNRGRKPTRDMLATMTSPLQRADYALGRIHRLEVQIADLLKQVGSEARALVVAERPSLRQYVKN